MGDFLERAAAYNSVEREIATNLGDIAAAFSASIIIARPAPGDAPAPRVFTASGGLVELAGGAPCLITNKHVLDVYRAEAMSGPTVFECADCALDPIARLWHEDESVDLAIIRMDGLRVRSSRSKLAGVSNLQLFQRATWPADPVKPGDKVSFAGWPESRSSIDHDAMEVTFTGYIFIDMEVRAVTDDQFSLLFERSKWHGVFGWETPEAMAERDLSGLSGAPIFREALRNGIIISELVGFVKEYQPTLDYLIATSANNILPDGRITPFRP